MLKTFKHVILLEVKRGVSCRFETIEKPKNCRITRKTQNCRISFAKKSTKKCHITIET